VTDVPVKTKGRFLLSDFGTADKVSEGSVTFSGITADLMQNNEN
jgi:hypothetical protein